MAVQHLVTTNRASFYALHSCCTKPLSPLRSPPFTPPQVYELLHDLKGAYLSRSEYFLGAIVTTKEQEGPNAASQVIDGQQRLTTLVMMLAYLQKWAQLNDNEMLLQRVRRMVFMEVDPLDPNSVAR